MFLYNIDTIRSCLEVYNMFDLSELEHLLPDEPSPEYNEQLSKINDYLVRIKPEVPAGILERLSTEGSQRRQSPPCPSSKWQASA